MVKSASDQCSNATSLLLHARRQRGTQLLTTLDHNPCGDGGGVDGGVVGVGGGGGGGVGGDGGGKPLNLNPTNLSLLSFNQRQASIGLVH